LRLNLREKGCHMTRLVLVLIGLMAGPAIAHPGHVGEITGHEHLGIILISLIAVISLWVALKGDKGAGAKDSDYVKELQEV